MHALLLLALLSADLTWQQQTLNLVNAERSDANRRELLIYGEVQQVRHPLGYDARLEESAQWWCDAIKGTGIADHFGWLNARGHLIDQNGRQISRVWLPTYQPDGLTYWGFRNEFLGIEGRSSENGVFLKRATPAAAVAAWRGSGWHDDPRQATKHYRNLIDPGWTHFGVGKQSWGAGKDSMIAEFLEAP